MPTHGEIAQSFGLDAERYDRTRPRYPAAMVDRITAALPGRSILDVGTGTGIAARQFRAAGCRVLGVEPDERMAAVARRHGIDVETAAFEQWDPAGRTFDGVTAGQTWHWVDPLAGAEQAARVLPRGGRLALFWNTFNAGPEVTEMFAEAYRRAAPNLPFSPWSKPTPSSPDKNDKSDLSNEKSPGGLDPFHDRAADGIRRSGRFGEPGLWTFEWEHTYTRGEWLDLVPTSGGHNLLPAGELETLLHHIGDAIGDTVTIGYRTVVTVAELAG
ncbi:class I SAM-dependent methyltransferase [Actinoplanes sp. OR16]|uniref:class I SAM-dependent methyltransferase n=1 Tax=Actinoplanes sp. OR16 TaxID=946334 RepID=UPI000FDA2879|nr:class I SAM-dependent methyltransferase [Actinoplanes sp. OR16]